MAHTVLSLHYGTQAQPHAYRPDRASMGKPAKNLPSPKQETGHTGAGSLSMRQNTGRIKARAAGHRTRSLERVPYSTTPHTA
ncbi:MAG: hypothetical protein ABF785_08025 [Acetobacter papayae]|uniref:hypothetical protein n=1 Tax=Acetobacter papayae TaxID=1076592 RepID=UPI0039EA0C4E